jgi:hypothetical protein
MVDEADAVKLVRVPHGRLVGQTEMEKLLVLNAFSETELGHRRKRSSERTHLARVKAIRLSNVLTSRGPRCHKPA